VKTKMYFKFIKKNLSLKLIMFNFWNSTSVSDEREKGDKEENRP